MPELTRPRLKQGETPQSPSFQKRMQEFNRQVALAEATAAQVAIRKREAEESAARDVLAEVSKAVAEVTPKPKSKAEPKKKPRIAESGRAGLEGRQAKLDAAEKETE